MIGILGGMGTQAGLDFCNKLAVINRGKIDQNYPLFMLYNKSNIPNRPQNLKKSSSSLVLLMRIRDEAHRFAISFQKSKRKKDLTKSIFSNVNGVGKKRLEKLLQLFNGPKEISESSPKIIHSKTGIPIKIATM